jgi:hypothetical protein
MNKKTVKSLSDSEVTKQCKLLFEENSRRSTAKAHKAGLLLVGRYFKTRNSYGSDESWWLYRKVTGADGSWLKCFSFQIMAGTRFEAVTEDSLHGVESYTEINKAEWDKALADFHKRLAKAIGKLEVGE